MDGAIVLGVEEGCEERNREGVWVGKDVGDTVGIEEGDAVGVEEGCIEGS